MGHAAENQDHGLEEGVALGHVNARVHDTEDRGLGIDVAHDHAPSAGHAPRIGNASRRHADAALHAAEHALGLAPEGPGLSDHDQGPRIERKNLPLVGEVAHDHAAKGQSPSPDVPGPSLNQSRLNPSTLKSLVIRTGIKIRKKIAIEKKIGIDVVRIN